MARSTRGLARQRIVGLIGWFLLICLTGGAMQTARADSLRVFPGEYLITQSKASNEPRDAEPRRTAAVRVAAFAPHRVMRSVGSGMSLIERGSSSIATFRVRASVPFDPSDSFCQSLVASGAAQSCSPNFEIRALGRLEDTADPLLADQWGFERVGADTVWPQVTTAPESLIAVVDSGVDYTHPDLRGVLWENPAEVPDNGIDDDGNGYIDDSRGVDVTTGRGDPMDRLGHGTHIAGIVAALPENGRGVRGLVPNAKILAVRIFDDQGLGSLAHAIEALSYIEQLRVKGVNVRVVNASWGGIGFSEELEVAIKKLGALGVVVAAAAGNSGTNNDKNPEYPASFALPNLLSVAAIDIDGSRASFSNYGLRSVLIAAPGDGIMSTVLRGDYAFYSGTSMAAPFMTSAAALLAAQEPNLSAADIVARIRSTARLAKSLSGVVASGGELSLPLLLGEVGGAAATGKDCVKESCSNQRARVRRVTARGRSRRGLRTSGTISPGDELEVQVRGSGSGSVSLVVALDGHRCQTRVPAKMVKGAGRVRLRTPGKLRSFRKISVISGHRSSSVSVRASRALSWVVANRAEQKKVCESLVVSAR